MACPFDAPVVQGHVAENLQHLHWNIFRLNLHGTQDEAGVQARLQNAKVLDTQPNDHHIQSEHQQVKWSAHTSHMSASDHVAFCISPFEPDSQ